MRTKILLVFIGFVFLLVAGVGIKEINKSDQQLSDLVFYNVEALAEIETITVDCDEWYKEECVKLIINGTEFTVSGRRK